MGGADDATLTGALLARTYSAAGTLDSLSTSDVGDAQLVAPQRGRWHVLRAPAGADHSLGTTIHPDSVPTYRALFDLLEGMAPPAALSVSPERLRRGAGRGAAH